MNKHLVHELVSEKARLYPERTAVTDTKRTLSYHELEQNSAALSAILLNMGLEQQQPVALYLPPSAEYIIALLAVFRAGGIAVPLDVHYPAQRIANCLTAASNPIIITRPETATAAAITGNTKTVIEIEWYGTGIRVAQAGNPLSIPTATAVVELNGDYNNYLLFTSGSTGQPKGILGKHKSLSHFIHWEIQQFGLNEHTRVPLLAPIGFDVSLRDIFVPLCAGGTLCVPGETVKQEPRYFMPWLQQQGITLIHCVPSLLRLFITALEEDAALRQHLDAVGHILVAGEPLYGKDVQAWRKAAGINTALVNLYGPTETTLAKIFFPVGHAEFASDEILPLGTPLPNTVALIVHDNRLCTPGEEGEILVKTPFATSGYVNNPALQAEKFIQNPLHNDFSDPVFKTGDIGCYDAEGRIRFLRRADNMVKLNGNRVEPGEVQQTALLLPAVQQAVALVRHNDAGEPDHLVLYYTAKEPVTENGWATHFGRYLPLYMHPSRYRRVEKIPLNANGKTDASALLNLPHEEPVPVAPTPSDEYTQAIVAAWKEVLKTEQEPGTESFFQSGGSSLKAIQLISRLYKQKGILLSIKEMLTQPTVSGIRSLMLEKVNGREKETVTTPVVQTALSVTQQQILSWSENEQQWADFNLPYVYEITGLNERALLTNAIQTVSRNYTFFNRRLIETTNGWQEIRVPEPGKTIEVIPVAGKTPEEIHELLQQLSRQPFPKNNMPPIKFWLLEKDTEQCWLLAVSHLVMADGDTLQALFTEITRAVLCEQQQITYVHNAALTFNEEHIQAEQEQAQRAGYWANLYEQVRTPNWPVLTAPMNSGHLQEHTFCLNEAEYQTLQQLAQTNDTSLNTVLLALTETVLGTLLNGEPFTLHTITSYRARYEHTVTANLLYYVPINFSAPATTVAAAIPLAKNRLAEMIDHLPLAMPQERVSPRPVMTLNITTATPVTPNSATANTRISIQPFNGVIHRERFPLNISMVAGEQLVHITVSALPGIPITGTGFETGCRQLLKNL